MPDNFRQEDRDRILRLEERMATVQKTVEDINETLKYMQDDLRKNYITKSEFWPYAKGIFMAAGAALSVLTAIAVQVWSRSGH